MPSLQGMGEFASDRRVKRFEARLKQRQPGVDPGVDGNCVS